MNPDLKNLQPYPFERLAKLKAGLTPPIEDHIALSIGEPKHDAPEIALKAIRDNLDLTNRYPLTKGVEELRGAIKNWLTRRFKLPQESIQADQHIIPVNGTREALFAIAQCFVDRTAAYPAGGPLVLMPNPFYQIYEGAALLAGAQPYYYPTGSETNYLPDFDAIDESTWQRCQLIYLCSPGNPTGSVINEDMLSKLIELSRKYDFIIVSDECYSEIYFDENNPPPGLLQVAAQTGSSEYKNWDYKNCLVFHSLSKRSNLPGLRSGFVAGDSELIKAFLLYRTYHGCAMPPVHQMASIAAWNDENHVIENRRRYTEKFASVIDILSSVIDVKQPDAGFYLWLKTPIADDKFARDLFATQNVTVLPGSYLSRDVNGNNPGKQHVRMALVAPLEECITAANRIKQYIQTLS